MVTFLILLGTVQSFQLTVYEDKAITDCLRFVRINAEPGDVLFASSYRTINRLRYYASNVGLSGIPIRCTLSPTFGDGQLAHIASLSEEDILWQSTGVPLRLERAWAVFDSKEEYLRIPDGLVKLFEEEFLGSNGESTRVVLYSRPVE